MDLSRVEDVCDGAVGAQPARKKVGSARRKKIFFFINNEVEYTTTQVFCVVKRILEEVQYTIDH